VIACFRGKGVVSDLIRWQTRGQYSHVAWLLPTGRVIESHFVGGVQISESPFVLNGINADFDVFSVKCLTGVQCASISSFLRRQIGRKYDYLGIIRFLAGINRDNENRWFCSELVAEACELAGRPLLKTDAWKISPESLAWSTELVQVEQNAGVNWWERTYGREVVLPEIYDDFDREALPA
jgi:uncharacterized protein YycO